MTSRASIIPAEACEDGRLSNLDYRILGILGREGGKGFVALQRAQLAKWAQCAESSVPRSVRRLKECGYVECLEQKSETGKTLPNLYRVRLDQPFDTHAAQDTHITEDTRIDKAGVSNKTPTSTPAKPQSQTQDVGRIPSDTGIEAAGLDPPKKENSPTPPIRKTTSSLRSDVGAPLPLSALAKTRAVEPRFSAFTELWALWRERDVVRRSRRSPSFEAFKAVVKAGADPERILAGARVFLANPDKIKDRGQFMLSLATWLTDQEWEEWADEWETEKRRRLSIFEHDGFWDAKWGPKPKSEGLAA